MAILEQSAVEIRNGFTKEVDSGSLGLMFDIMQRFQYTYPIKSSVRELVSNGIDSVSEKNAALKILSGQAQVSDYYEVREGELYKDSKFVPEYYDPNWLSSEDNVVITYHRSKETEKDFVTITDYGVGLGGSRLEKYFNLGHSTKRLSKLPLGKFGIGAKAPLSVNSYYTVESRYNGLKFMFNVYNADIESIVPAFDLETGVPNVEVEFKGGKVFAYRTEEKNGVTIKVEAKKHHFTEYKDAIEKQLMYFSNVKYVVEDNGYKIEQAFKPTILFEDEFLLISDNKMYTRPHILLNKVNYG